MTPSTQIQLLTSFVSDFVSELLIYIPGRYAQLEISSLFSHIRITNSVRLGGTSQSSLCYTCLGAQSLSQSTLAEFSWPPLTDYALDSEILIANAVIYCSAGPDS